MTPDEVYQSIFLEPDWVYEKYYGWKTVVARPKFRVLLKSAGPIKRYLILSQLDHKQLRSKLSKTRVFGPLSMVTVKDFSTPSQVNCTELLLGELRLPRVKDTERMLNKYTFVIDLTQGVDKLWSNMKSDNQRVCKKATASGMSVACVSSPADNILATFFQRYKTMASERSLVMPSRAVIGQMFKDGCLRMFYAKTDNTIHTMILVYSAALTSFFLYGVPGDKRNDGSGQFVHWQAIEYLKCAGQRWYDLGGVPDVGGSNGIYRFKMSLGGDLVDLGPEYYYCSSALLIAKNIYRRLRTDLPRFSGPAVS